MKDALKHIQISKETTTIIKGLACLIIVAHHYCSWLMGKGYGNTIVNFIGVRGGVVGVAIFFFLSSWGLCESQARNHYSFESFVKRRLLKVYVPLIITNFLYYIILLLIGSISFNLPDLLLNTFNLKFIDGVLWFCNTIMIFYLVFYLSFIPESKWVSVSICLICTFAYSVVSTIIYPDSPFYVYSIVAFPLGLICSLYKESLIKITRWGSWCVIILFFLLSASIIFPSYSKLFLMNSFILIFLVLLVAIIQRLKISGKYMVLSYIGLYSYEIYLLHNKVLVPMGESNHLLLYPLVFVLIVIPFAVLLNKIVKIIIKIS